MRSPLLTLAALSAALAVAMGAFGAHVLKTVLTAEMLAVYKTAVNYQMWHALGLGLVALVQQQGENNVLLQWAGRLMFTGIILFSGSLYLLVLLDWPRLGMITPVGGVSWLIAWCLLLVYAAKKQD
ncbi:DUF423 domain-containing protein [methane-oxidizing endosymbiont of Gigantopelta aegis]|uniref:DUF423 domain-containing protein n=1 Tax=methane-oxidizing endosymbiont of Gigantopelta aegis TaxID=2794938 RepID=UPI0018DEC124|nr:DUF423 domain-containing protein [methane-oxidizing endosymbiont of Gigantopelta aegis]